MKFFGFPHYHCCLNAIEMVWTEVKNNICYENVYNESTENIIALILDTFIIVSPESWINYIHHVEEEDGFWERDKIIDEDIGPDMIGPDVDTDDEFFDDESVIPKDV